jgi:hypothetical protein
VIAFLLGAQESGGPDSYLEEIIDLGGRVLAPYRWIMRGQHSAGECELRFSEIATFREGRVILIELFLEHEQAPEALEMPE